MSSLTIEIPERVKDRMIYIQAGTENIAVYCPQEKTLWVKVKECSLCGKCCIVDKTWDAGVKSGDEVGWSRYINVCKYLTKEVRNFEPFNGKTVYICTAGPMIPYFCNLGPSPACGKECFKKGFPDCTLEYRKVVL